jgi:hypothetical protein
MKKILIGLVAMTASVAFGGSPIMHDYLNIAWPKSYTNGTMYSSEGDTTNSFNLTAYNGLAKLIVFVSADQGTVANTNSDVVFLQHASAATGTYSTVTDIAASMPTLSTTGKVVSISLDLETLKNWVRLGVKTSSMGETNASHTVGAVLVTVHKND